MLTPGIISRPVYGALQPDTRAKHNLLVAEGEGAAAILDLAAKAPPDFFSKTTILYCAAGSAGKGYEKQLEDLNPDALWVFPTPATTMFRLKGVLQTAKMGTRLYFTGTEPFMGLALREVLVDGMAHT